jgi:hypothetical protein
MLVQPVMTAASIESAQILINASLDIIGSSAFPILELGSIHLKNCPFDLSQGASFPITVKKRAFFVNSVRLVKLSKIS